MDVVRAEAPERLEAAGHLTAPAQDTRGPSRRLRTEAAVLPCFLDGAIDGTPHRGHRAPGGRPRVRPAG
ncbi:hypothetical protein ABZ519_27025 [Streptomyces collinus]|uniref:hypothetical protein n=1 Tax=Streptomyces collinus TaxID=42684 RepID=UPI00341059D3